MGNNNQSQSIASTKYNLPIQLKNDNHVLQKTISKVDDIPIGTPPPSIQQILDRSKDFIINNRMDPTKLQTIRDVLVRSKTTNRNQHNQLIIEKLKREITAYTPENPAFSEKTIKLRLDNQQEIWVSSTKNSDQTISYWIQYPVLPIHIQKAMLKCMNVDITVDNLHAIQNRYNALYTRIVNETKNQVGQTEQLDPLFFDAMLRSLVIMGYKPFHKSL